MSPSDAQSAAGTHKCEFPVTERLGAWRGCAQTVRIVHSGEGGVGRPYTAPLRSTSCGLSRPSSASPHFLAVSMKARGCRLSSFLKIALGPAAASRGGRQAQEGSVYQGVPPAPAPGCRLRIECAVHPWGWLGFHGAPGQHQRDRCRPALQFGVAKAGSQGGLPRTLPDSGPCRRSEAEAVGWAAGRAGAAATCAPFLTFHPTPGGAWRLGSPRGRPTRSSLQQGRTEHPPCARPCARQGASERDR